MIVVIADDFTGAAELGGIGLRYNLKVEVNTCVNLQSIADLLVIATDTRSMSRQDAEIHMKMVTEQVAALNPSFIFKKVDSVLRGYVAEELTVHLQQSGHSRALLIPANPVFGRTIVDGNYHLNGELLHLTNFAYDPEFPANSSSVVELLHQKGIEIHSQKHHDTIAEQGVIVGDVTGINDLNAWADKVNDGFFFAGASGFFTALLDKLIVPNGQPQPDQAPAFNLPVLIVSGTAFGKSADAIKKLKEDGQPVSYMPALIINAEAPDQTAYEQWCVDIISLITNFDKAIIAIDPAEAVSTFDKAASLRKKTAAIVKMVVERIAVHELLLEGGSTASSVLKQLSVEKLFPVEELAPGVVRMSAENHDNLYITMKPGSYSWPHSISQYSLY